ncbi:autotransporter domain-containing protein [Martelella alba]|uniref:Autotransporter domain-containing protein n=1 Tax=Martelella alba TaxID=2590451 RepID=A0A506UH63_9HYPH|nr:autotransporter domain-containing protein [Martelella alba]TPW32417.1 autotransporter domain-containing protein [Martelella alba]
MNAIKKQTNPAKPMAASPRQSRQSGSTLYRSARESRLRARLWAGTLLTGTLVLASTGILTPGQLPVLADETQYWNYGKGGSGTWSSTAYNWVDENNQTGVWAGDTGIFNTASGTVTLASDQYFVELDFPKIGSSSDTSFYTLTGNYLRSGSSAATIYVGTDQSALIMSTLALGGDFTKTGGGTLTLNSPNGDGGTIAGETKITDGTLNFNGLIYVTDVYIGGRNGAVVNIDYGQFELCGTSGSCETTQGGGMNIGVEKGTSGKLMVTGDGQVAAVPEHDSVIGKFGHGELWIVDGGKYAESGEDANNATARIRFADGENSTAFLYISGDTSELTTQDDPERTNINIGNFGDATAIIEDGAEFLADGEFLIATNGGNSTVTIDGDGSKLVNKFSGAQQLVIGNAGNGTLILSNGGKARVNSSDSTAILGYYDIYLNTHYGKGTLIFGSAPSATETTASAGALEVDTLEFGPGQSTLIFNHTATADHPYAFDVTIETESKDSSTNTIQQLSGVTSFEAYGSEYFGTVEINGGTLDVSGVTLGGTYTVNGGTLAGKNGTVGTLTVGADAASVIFAATASSTVPILSPGDVDGNIYGVITVDGDLTLAKSAVLDMQLGSNNSTNSMDRVDVEGDVTLGGTLNVQFYGPHQGSEKEYPIITYTGSVSGAFDEIPENYMITYDTVTIKGETKKAVLLVWATLEETGFYWNGGATAEDEGHGLTGGSGTWSLSNAAWTNQDGSAPEQEWPFEAGNTAIFAGSQGGTVTVAGVQLFGKLDFRVTQDQESYLLSGGTLSPSPKQGETAEISVDPNVEAVISSAIASTDGSRPDLEKVGAGQLTLTNSDNVVGRFQLSEGTVVLKGQLTADDVHILDWDASKASGAAVMRVDGGALDVDYQLVVGYTSIDADDNAKQVSKLLVTNKAKVTAGYLLVGNFNELAPATVEVTNGGRLQFETLTLVGLFYGSAVLLVDGSGSRVSSSGNLTTGYGGGTGKVILSNSGELEVDGSFTLGEQANESTGILIFGEDPDTQSAARVTTIPGVFSAEGLYFGGGDAKLIFNHAAEESDNFVFDTKLVAYSSNAKETNTIEQLSGYTYFKGDGSQFSGTVNITGGTLDVTNDLMGQINVGGVDLMDAYLVLPKTNINLGDISILSSGKVDLSKNQNPMLTVTVSSFSMQSEHSELYLYANFTDDYGQPVSSNIHSTGAVSLQDGTIFIYHEDIENPVTNDPVLIISSDQSIDLGDGMDFEPQEEINGIQLDDILSDDNKSLYVQLVVKDEFLSDATVSMSANAAAMTNSLISLGGVHSLPVNFALTDAAQRDWVAQIMSGDIYASEASAMVANSRYVRDATGQHIRDISGGIATGQAIATVSNYAAQPSAATTPAFDGFSEANSGIDLWATGYGAWSSFDGDTAAGTASASNNVGGFIFGADASAFGNLRLGALGAYGHSSFKADDHYASGTSNDVTFGMYGGGNWGAIGVNFGAAYTWHDIDTNRTIKSRYFDDALDSDYSAGTFQLFGGVGYMFDLGGGVRLEPFLDAAYVHYQADNFSENGGLLALSVLDSDMNTGYTTVGLRGAWDFDIGATQNKLTGALGWRHAYGDTEPFANVGFALGGDMQMIQGTPLASDQAVINVGWVTELNKTVSIGVDYTGLFGGGYESQTVSGKLNIRF